MAIKLEATQEFVDMIEKSAREWKKIKHLLDEEYHKYDVYSEDEFGIKVDFSIVESAEVTAVVIKGAEVIDDEKYINFLLRYGEMHDD